MYKYETVNEYSTIPEINENISDIFKYLKNLKIIERKKKPIRNYIGVINTNETKNIETKDIKIPKNLKILNKNKPILTLNSKNFKIKILIKIKKRRRKNKANN